MSRSSTFIELVALLAVGLIPAGSGATDSVALAQETPGSAPQRATNPNSGKSQNERLRDLAQPGLRWGVLSENDLVPPEKREALGVDDTAWTRRYGKVHPDVYKSLDKAEQITEPWLDVSGHTGTVYVQVQFKYEQRDKADSAENKAAVRQVQGKVLSQLTAAEFYVEYPFRNLPAFLGYATRAGVEKLKTNPDVLAVSLDEKPLPRETAHVTSEDLPTGKPGDPATQAAQGRFWGSGGKVEADVYRALAARERVFVIVLLTERPVEETLVNEVGRSRALENGVLASLSAEDFWVCNRTAIHSANAPLLMGAVNGTGLRKLQNHPDVAAVGLDSATRAPRRGCAGLRGAF